MSMPDQPDARAPAPAKPVPIQDSKPDAKPGAKPEFGGPAGPEPTRYGDWERNGRCSDF